MPSISRQRTEGGSNHTCSLLCSLNFTTALLIMRLEGVTRLVADELVGTGCTDAPSWLPGRKGSVSYDGPCRDASLDTAILSLQLG
jgi:hypothetical protein